MTFLLVPQMAIAINSDAIQDWSRTATCLSIEFRNCDLEVFEEDAMALWELLKSSFNLLPTVPFIKAGGCSLETALIEHIDLEFPAADSSPYESCVCILLIDGELHFYGDVADELRHYFKNSSEVAHLHHATKELVAA
jgi:hypothetical protein